MSLSQLFQRVCRPLHLHLPLLSIADCKQSSFDASQAAITELCQIVLCVGWQHFLGSHFYTLFDLFFGTAPQMTELIWSLGF